MLHLFLLGAAFASVEAEDRWLRNANLSIGLHQDGSLVNPATELGILWDPDGSAGEMPLTGDMIRVGYHWDGWAWSYWGADGTEAGFQVGPHRSDFEAMSWTDGFSNEALDGLNSSLSIGPLEIQLRSMVLARADVLIQDFTITTDETVSYMKLGRTVDADQDEWLTGSRSTINDAGLGYASSMGEFDERTLAIGGGVLGGDLGQGGICAWCDSIEEMEDESSTSSSADQQAFVVVDGGTLHSDDETTIRFVYAFAVGESGAQDLALEMLSLDDLDGDGLSVDEGDCDDLDPDTYADATELIDGVDNDCDGEIDEDTLGADDDGDGFSEAEGDCDDADSAVFPGAEPVDGVTNADCDGVEDPTTGDTDVSEETGDTGDPGDTEDTGAPGEDTGAAGDDTGERDAEDDPPEDDPPAGDDDDDASADSEAASGVVGSDEKHSGCSHARTTPPLWLLSLPLACLVTRRRS